MKKSIALVSGGWSQNIGNAFFNIGGMFVLRSVFGDAKCEFIQDQPGYWTFNFRRNPSNDLGLLKHLKVDYLVLQGPVMSKTFMKLWPETLKALHGKGTKVILLSAGLFRYTDEEIEIARRMLKTYPPFLVSTRDHRTYEAVFDCCDRCYSGIDSAFFVPDVYDPLPIDIDHYITVNFDRLPEPRIILRSEEERSLLCDHTFRFADTLWCVQYPPALRRLALKGKVESYLAAFLDFRRLTNRIGPFTIVRPEHRFNPHVWWKIYRHGNAVVSDEPFTYFSLYAGTSLTLSDRVHACVVTLAYGKPAMLFSPSPRTYLFDRLGLSNIRNEPVVLGKEQLEKEKDAQIEFLRSAIS